MVGGRTKETLALLAIGDGVAALVQPKRHVRLWAEGPWWWRRMMRPFEGRPNLTRAFGAAEAAFGLWWASRQTR